MAAEPDWTVLLPSGPRRERFSDALVNVLKEACSLAVRAGHSRVGEGHLLYALSTEPLMAAWLVACKTNLADLRATFESVADDETKTGRPAMGQAMSGGVREALRHAEQWSSGQIVPMTVLMTFIDTGRWSRLVRVFKSRHTPHDRIQAALTRNGVTHQALYNCRARIKTPPGYLKVLIHNDETTKMDFVVAILTTHFGLSMGLASHVMLETHQSGEAVVGYWPLAEADARVEHARVAIAHSGFPLRLSSR